MASNRPRRVKITLTWRDKDTGRPQRRERNVDVDPRTGNWRLDFLEPPDIGLDNPATLVITEVRTRTARQPGV